MRWLERRASPPMVGRAPKGVSFSKELNQEVDNLTWLLDVATRLRDGFAAVFPGDLDAKGNPEWDLRELKIDNRAGVYESALERLWLEMLKGLVVPDKPVQQGTGSTGSFALANVQFRAFLTTREAKLHELLDYYNRYVVTPIVRYNFGVGSAKATIETLPLSEEVRTKLFEAFRLVVQAKHPDVANVALQELSKVLEIPYLPGPPRPLGGGTNGTQDKTSDTGKGAGASKQAN